MRALLVSLLVVVLAWNAQAASVTARLVRASNEDRKSDEALKDIQPKLKKIFGYQHYRQIGLQKAALKGNDTLRLNLGEGIVLLVTPKSVEKKNHTVDCEMYSGKTALMKSTMRIREGGDVLIKGPEVGSTLLIIALGIAE
jgi:hypothetical protein